MPLAIGLVHVALVASRYHVGSFDDDASYLLNAKAFLAGQGLTGHLVSGEPLVGLYLPGFGALLTPVVWLSPHSFVLARLVCVACYAASFPLVWILGRRRGVSETVALGALLLLALGPVDATFAGMVMAESPFLAVLLLLLLAVDPWLREAGVVGRRGWAVILAAAALLWLKQAGLGLVVGLILWILVDHRIARRVAKAGFLAAAVVVAVVPVVVARIVVGLPLAGDRYSTELGVFYQGGLLHRLVHVLPHSAWQLVSTAIPATVVPYLSPLPIGGHWPDLWKVLSWQVTVLCLVGAVVGFRRRPDAVPAMIAVYLGESVLWPMVNERRAILVFPVLVLWYSAGAAALWTGLGRLARGGLVTTRAATAIVAATAVTFAPLAVQAPRDYLYAWGQHSSEPAGSRYAAMLSRLGPKDAVVETDYRSTVALLSGRRTGWEAFLRSSQFCYEPASLGGLAADHAGFLLLGDLNKPGLVDSPCLAQLVAGAPWAVPLLHTTRDDASVYELIGPSTGNPALGSVIKPSTPATVAHNGDRSVWTWVWSVPLPVTQVSVGEAVATSGPTSSVSVQVRRASGTWTTLMAVPGGVGDCARCRPFLLDGPRAAYDATAVRVVVTAGAPGLVSDLAVIGPVPTPTRS